MLYVLSIFATMGSLFCASRWFSVRSFSHSENEIAYLHWMHIGRLMGINVDAAKWKCYDDVLQYKSKYEAQYCKYCDSNFTVASKTIFFFSSAFPAWARFFIFPASLHVVSAMQANSATSSALGLPNPNCITRFCVHAFLVLRAFLFRIDTRACNAYCCCSPNLLTDSLFLPCHFPLVKGFARQPECWFLETSSTFRSRSDSAMTHIHSSKVTRLKEWGQLTYPERF